MRVKDWMTPSPITVPADHGVFDARRLMDERRIRHLPITQDGDLVGIVTDRDIRLNLPSPATSLSVWEVNYILGRLAVGEVMTRTLITIGPDRDIAAAARLMVDHRIGALPVMDAGRLVGLITETDLLRALLHREESPGAPRVAAAAPRR